MKITVKKAVFHSFNQLPEVFSLLNLINIVRSVTERPYLTDGTITRRLRELRSEPETPLNYRVIDNHKAIYKKIKPVFSFGNIPVYGNRILAPLDGISIQPFRLLCRKMGAAVTYTEFINVLDVPKNLNYIEKRTCFSNSERPIGIPVNKTPVLTLGHNSLNLLIS